MARTDDRVTMKGLRLRPDEQGTRAALFDLEADIMDVVWDAELDSFTVGDVHRRLEEVREIAYTTVMTTVSRLHDKGLLDREREGRRYRYRPLYDRQGLALAMANEVLDNLEAASDGAAVALLVERVARADDRELAQLEALIRKRRKELSDG